MDGNATTQAPICPGCHFGCRIDYYQCARGLGFLERWEAGGEIPERRAPGPGRPGGKPGAKPDARDGAGAPPLEGQVMHLLMLVNMFGKRATELGPHVRVAQAALMHDGFATPFVASQRAQLEGDAFEDALQRAVDEGLVELGEDEHGRTFLMVTDSCREQGDAWRKQAREAQVAFLGALDGAETEQLRDLLARLLEANRPAR